MGRLSASLAQILVHKSFNHLMYCPPFHHGLSVEGLTLGFAYLDVQPDLILVTISVDSDAGPQAEDHQSSSMKIGIKQRYEVLYVSALTIPQ